MHADLHHAYNSRTKVAAPSHGATLARGDDAPGAIDAAEPVPHDWHQSGEFPAKLAIHGFDV